MLTSPAATSGPADAEACISDSPAAIFSDEEKCDALKSLDGHVCSRPSCRRENPAPHRRLFLPRHWAAVGAKDRTRAAPSIRPVGPAHTPYVVTEYAHWRRSKRDSR